VLLVVTIQSGAGANRETESGSGRMSIFVPLSAEPHSRGVIRARSFILAVQREVILDMSKRSETNDPARMAPHDATAEGTIDALKELIADLLPDERPTIERVAPRLGMSVRTLQRRLHDWEHSFEDIVDDTRRDVAIERLTTGETSITETAFSLGYSDLSHFTRAFRRWTGTTPREFAAARRHQGSLKS
jgi:AraC-like DNA-binding protein